MVTGVSEGKTDVHPARLASQRSVAAVQAKDKASWLALWAEDGCVEDPVGVSFIDPVGEGFRGPERLEEFWDNNIGPTDSIVFALHDSFAAGSEVANVATITITVGGNTVTKCEGVFVYRVNDEGKLISLRAFWETDRMMATLHQT
ncbi:MAG: nuclear transport factor 2 family protein [Actinomycetota bacterium]|nr:nuclear transport factor 2 family protein [Actinomycetota bacterium]